MIGEHLSASQIAFGARVLEACLPRAESPKGLFGESPKLAAFNIFSLYEGCVSWHHNWTYTTAEEQVYTGTAAGRPITFWIDWKPDGKLAGTYRFEGRMFSFAGNNFSEGVIDIADDDGDQTVLRKVVARGRVIWRGLIRGGQFDGEVVEIMRARNEPTGIVYTTFLGENDHYNSNGVRLNSVADILRQDRANYHSGLGDQREEDDGGIFATKQGLSKFGNYSIVLDRLTPSDILRGRYGSVVVQVIGQKIYVEGVE